MEQAGLPSDTASGYSLRCGFATSACEKQVLEHITKPWAAGGRTASPVIYKTHKSTLAYAHLALAGARVFY